MFKSRALRAAVAAAPSTVLLFAYATGPDPRHTAAPGDDKLACATSGCHTGTPLNGGGGNVKINFSNGQTYTPGVAQTFSIVITDAVARAYGFQITARLESSPATGQAGDFVAGVQQLVLCDDSNVKTATRGCPANASVQFLEHSQPFRTNTISASWTPPATNVGNVHIYVAANAANFDGNNTGDHIYTADYVLTPAAAGGTSPTIDAGGVQNGASFQAGLVPNSWITIKGSNLAAANDTWDKSIVNGNLPTSLDGVSVKVGGKDAYIYFVSPAQINAIAPDVGAGNTTVTVTNGGGTSAAFAAVSNPIMPAFFLWPGNQTVATRVDGSFVVKAGTFSGLTTTPAKPGDIVILWGTGFGPTSPAAPVGVQTPADQLYNTANAVTVTVGGAPATVFGAALSPGFAGLYQVAIQIPANAANGDLPVVASVGGAQSPTGVTVAVQQ